MADSNANQTTNQLKSIDNTSNSDDDGDVDDNVCTGTLNHNRKRDRTTNDVDISSTDLSSHAKKKHHKRKDRSENNRRRDRKTDEKKSKKKKKERHDKRKRIYRDDSDSRSDSHADSDEEDDKRRRKRERKGSKKEKKHSRHRRQDELNDTIDDSKRDTTIRRSVITGEKIQLKIVKTAEDVIQEQARKQLLEFMNASYK